MVDIDNYAPTSGRIIGEDGEVYNLVDLLSGAGGPGGKGGKGDTGAPGKAGVTTIIPHNRPCADLALGTVRDGGNSLVPGGSGSRCCGTRPISRYSFDSLHRTSWQAA